LRHTIFRAVGGCGLGSGARAPCCRKRPGCGAGFAERLEARLSAVVVNLEVLKREASWRRNASFSPREAMGLFFPRVCKTDLSSMTQSPYHIHTHTSNYPRNWITPIRTPAAAQARCGPMSKTCFLSIFCCRIIIQGLSGIASRKLLHSV